MSVLLGIDLGTTNCSVTAIDENGNTTIVKNRDNEYITPSAVYFNTIPNNYIIGKRAKEKASTDPKNLVTLVKREMGKVKEEVRFNRYDRKFHPYIYWGRTFSPEEVSSKILNQLKQDAQAALDCEISKAVITCPAYFGQNEKEATRLAGELAGLEVLEVIPEPTAACLQYGTMSKKDNERIFVFDLGGGTFDITIVDVTTGSSGKKIDVKCCGGDSKLGGADWDYYMLDYMLNRFDREYHVDLAFEEGAEKDITYGKLTLDVERAKKELSKPDVNETTIVMEYGGAKLEEVITRKKYAEITDQLTEQCKTYCQNLLQDNNLTWKDIDTILMVGSMSNCLFIQEALEKWSGKPVNFGIVNPKTCVSEGAAIRAYSKLCASEGRQTVVKTHAETFKYDSEDPDAIAKIEEQTNNAERVSTVIESATSVLPASICLKLLRKGEDYAYKMLKQNQSYPCSFVKEFPLSKDDMDEVTLTVLEGEKEDPSYCVELGSAVLPLEGSHAKGDKVSVSFNVDENGIIQVSGIDLKTNKTVKAEIRRKNTLSSADIAKAKEDVDNDEFELP